MRDFFILDDELLNSNVGVLNLNDRVLNSNDKVLNFTEESLKINCMNAYIRVSF
jgi:hypothetical protein